MSCSEVSTEDSLNIQIIKSFFYGFVREKQYILDQILTQINVCPFPLVMSDLEQLSTHGESKSKGQKKYQINRASFSFVCFKCMLIKSRRVKIYIRIFY